MAAGDQGSNRWVVTALARRHRTAVTLGVDMLAWAVSLSVATILRQDFDFHELSWSVIGRNVLLACFLQFVAGQFVGLYRGRFRAASFDDAAAIAAVVTFVTCLVVAFGLAVPPRIPILATLAGGGFALLVMAGARAFWRHAVELQLRPTVANCKRALVFGAGNAGKQVIDSMLSNPHSPYYPVAILDDDPREAHRSLRGVQVVGNRDKIASCAAAFGATVIIIAIPSADAGLIRDVTGRAIDAGLDVKILPSVSELIDGSVGVADIRPITERDLLGRREVEIDLCAIAEYLTDRRVLVTGAGGSIGSELCRQLERYAPAELVLLDRDESALHAVELSMHGRALLDDPHIVIADIRDRERLDEVFARWQPEVVFHAAALKHLPLLELHPEEAFKTNVMGTINVLDAAIAHDVERFVNISTDKAADPISVLGHTKRVAERVTSDAALRTGRPFLSVRFGNVLGSRGSVLTAFRAQIAQGGPVTVTDADVTRYFMTVEEAVTLVIQAGAAGAPGEALVLDMGQPVRIGDVAQRLVAQSQRHIEIIYTGLRPGEKLHEQLLASDEVATSRAHPLIFHTVVPPLSPNQAIADAALLCAREVSSARPRRRNTMATHEATAAHD